MDLLSELEIMANNVVDDSDAGPELELSDSVITRWQQLFCYTRAEAISRIEQHRNNFSRERVTDEHWEMVCCAKEAANLQVLPAITTGIGELSQKRYCRVAVEATHHLRLNNRKTFEIRQRYF